MPYPMLTIEAAFFSTPKALMSGGGRRSVGPPMSKFWRDLNHGMRTFNYLDDKGWLTSAFELPSTYLKVLEGHQMCPVPHGSLTMLMLISRLIPCR